MRRTLKHFPIVLNRQLSNRLQVSLEQKCCQQQWGRVLPDLESLVESAKQNQVSYELECHCVVWNCVLLL